MHPEDTDISAIADTVEGVLHAAPRPVALHEPTLGAREKELAIEAIESGWVSSGGQHIKRFEAAVARYMGVRHGIATVNGTTALHAALTIVGVQPGDEILVPAITFAATANAVSHASAVPHFVDSDWKTFGVDPAALEQHLENIGEPDGKTLRNRITKRPIRALIPVHVFGHPAEMERIVAVAAKFSLIVIEDAAEALGSTYRGRHCGSFGRCATMSFNGNKIVTTGGGGMILTDDDDLAKAAMEITTTAKRPHSWEFFHDRVAYNYRLPNLNAALGCAQMEQLDGFVEAKRKLAERYMQAFRNSKTAYIVREPAESRSNYWLNTLVLNENLAEQRDFLLRILHEHQILARPLWIPMNELPMYRDCPAAPLPVAKSMYARCISLPSSPGLA